MKLIRLKRAKVLEKKQFYFLNSILKGNSIHTWKRPARMEIWKTNSESCFLEVLKDTSYF